MTADLIRISTAELTGADAVGSALLALNNAHAMELSWLEPDKLRHLVAQAFLAKRIGEADAFLLAFDQAADYDSPNFLWFRALSPLRLRRPDRCRRPCAGARPCAPALSRPVRTGAGFRAR